MESEIQVQILDEDDCTSLYNNVLEKGMNPFVLLIAMDK